MNKLFSLLLLSFTTSSVFCQVSTDSSTMYLISSNRFQAEPYVSFNAQGGVASNFVNKALVFNNYWTTEMITDQVEAFTDRNRFGSIINSSVHYHSAKATSKNWSTFYGASYTSLTGLIASSEALATALQGNKPNRLINFEKLHGYEQWNTYSLDFGFEKVDPIKRSYNRVHLSIIGGSQLNVFGALGGSLHTDSSGETIVLSNTNMDFLSSNSGALPGYGLSLSYEWYKRINQRTSLQAQLNNVGFVHWDMTKYTVTSNVIYDGINVTQAVVNGTEINVQDTFKDAYISENSANGFVLFPFDINISLHRQINKRSALEAELSYLNFLGYIPKVVVLYKQQFMSNGGHWELGTTLGGFGNYALILGLEMPLTSNIGFRGQVTGMETLISPSLPVYWYGNLGLSLTL